MDLVKELTDVKYSTKSDVMNQVGRHLLEPIWNEISAYRKDYLILIDDVEFCLCPGILKKMTSCYEQLMKGNVLNISSWGNVLSENGIWLFDHYLKTESALDKRIHDLCLLYQCQDEHLLLKMTCSAAPVLCQVCFVMMKYGKTEFGILMLTILLKDAGMKSLMDVLSAEDLEILNQKDGTYALEDLMRKCASKLTAGSLKEKKSIDYEHLMYQYPQLKNYQILFYLDHHEPGFYYTIEQFVAYSDVCYETGRSALKQMSDLGFYQMMKQGKKFVYTVR